MLDDYWSMPLVDTHRRELLSFMLAGTAVCPCVVPFLGRTHCIRYVLLVSLASINGVC